MDKVDYSHLYKTQWRATFKNEVCSPTIVYGESEDEARRNALAHYRKNKTMLNFWGVDDIVDHVEYIG